MNTDLYSSNLKGQGNPEAQVAAADARTAVAAIGHAAALSTVAPAASAEYAARTR